MKISDFLNKIASFYIIFFSYENIKSKKIIKKYRKKIKNKLILDVGCGYGIFSKNISYFAKSVDAIDIDNKILKNSIKRKNINYFNIDINEYNTKNKYDFITCFHVIEHIKDDKFAFKKMVSLTKDNGYIFISTPHKKSIMSHNFNIKNTLKKFKFSELLKEKPHEHERAGYDVEDFIKLSEDMPVEILEVFYDKEPIILYEIYFLMPVFMRLLLLPFFSFLESIYHKFDQKDGLNIYVLFVKKSKLS
ncbi:MAG: class I SAM-dependent methyltransferase [Candidatus Aenigmarchaeota archaeon]|nr:class I SAM-dependent methyltransferase [Candidatus Aenigmarchaeota archaeon]